MRKYITSRCVKVYEFYQWSCYHEIDVSWNILHLLDEMCAVPKAMANARPARKSGGALDPTIKFMSFCSISRFDAQVYARKVEDCCWGVIVHPRIAMVIFNTQSRTDFTVGLHWPRCPSCLPDTTGRYINICRKKFTKPFHAVIPHKDRLNAKRSKVELKLKNTPKITFKNCGIFTEKPIAATSFPIKC